MKSPISFSPTVTKSISSSSSNSNIGFLSGRTIKIDCTTYSTPVQTRQPSTFSKSSEKKK